MGEMRNSCKTSFGKCQGKRLLETPKHRRTILKCEISDFHSGKDGDFGLLCRDAV
jgi:hypothetical protein